MESTLLLLTPLIFYFSWSMFILSASPMVSLAALLTTSVGLPLAYAGYTKIFWPCGLFLILMTTGLIVIFAYIVSLHPKAKKETIKPLSLSALLLSMGLMITATPLGFVQKVFLPMQGIYMAPQSSLLLVVVLLFLVIAFIRIVYSKGGGFRKKF